MTQELRTLFLDSHWCEKDATGGLSLPLSESMEVPGQDLVAFVDDFTVAGSFTAVNPSTNKLYVLEETPTGFTYNDSYVLFKKDEADAGTVYSVFPIDKDGPPDPQYEQFEYYMVPDETQGSRG